MIQNFNFELKRAHKYKQEDFDHHYKSEAFHIYLKADAKNNIFLTRYLCPKEFEVYFENVSNFIQDKHLDDLLSSLYSSVFSFYNLEFLEKEKLHFLNITLLHFKEALYLYRGDIRSNSHFNEDKIICRCMGIDQNKLKSLVFETTGLKSEILKSSNISLICGSCSEDFRCELSFLQKSEKVYEGRTFSDWEREILKLIEEFHFYSPKEFGGAKIELIEVNLPSLTFRIMSQDNELSVPLAKRSLTNYLGEELKQPLDIIVSLNKPD